MFDGTESRQSGAIQYELLGYDVGYRLTERLSQKKVLSGEALEAVKFVCKDFWTETFAKQVDKLQTDHRGTFVLKDLYFKWLGTYAPGFQDYTETAMKILKHKNFSASRNLRIDQKNLDILEPFILSGV